MNIHRWKVLNTRYWRAMRRIHLQKGLNIHYRKELMVRSIPRSSKNGLIGFQYDLVQYNHHSSRRMMVVYRKLAHLLDELMIPVLETMSYYIMFIQIYNTFVLHKFNLALSNEDELPSLTFWWILFVAAKTVSLLCASKHVISQKSQLLSIIC